MNLQKSNIDNIQLGVLGFPLSHTLSPVIHDYWLKKYDIKGLYEVVEVKPDDLKSFFNRDIHLYRGLNVTIPYKIDVFQFMDEIDQSARVIGAINCISINKEGRLLGKNTDADGFISGLIEFIPDIDFEDVNIMIIGAGGASRAIIHSLILKSVRKITITNRSTDRLISINKDFHKKLTTIAWGKKDKELSNADIIINCTSLGMLGNDNLEIDINLFKPNAIIVDLVYNPIETDLIKRAKVRGHRVLNGLPMLLHQAALSWKIWFDIMPDITNELVKIVEGKLEI
ncbi:MAG: shikimate dehydrogenase [Hyphomicrobiales bacterium]|nr:shikimate dehydrogenase [Hyphomicrobiales bacterium]